MKIFVAGGTGAIGRPLIAELLARVHAAVALTRSPERARGLWGILRFRARGGGLLVTRDHMDLGRAGSRPFGSYALDQPGAYEVAGVEPSEVEAGEEAKAAGVLRQ